MTEARKRFLALYDFEKVAECENYISLAYWRKGELIEAETWIEASLFHNFPDSNQTRLYSFIIRYLIFFQLNKYEENLRHLKSVENVFKRYGTDRLKGDFFNHYGLNLRKVNKDCEALEKYLLARKYFLKADHQIYLAVVENNLANIYRANRDFARAHEAIDNSEKIFKKINDRTREGFSLDTKASIYCDEQKYPQALETVEKAIAILRRSENLDYLTETILSKAKILLYLDDFTNALVCLAEAIELARTKISEARAADLAKQFEAAMEEKNSPKVSQTFEEKEFVKDNPGTNLELVLHPSISHYEEFQGVWIKNSHLESFGLRKGSLAVVIKDNIKRGDLIAIVEIDSEAVICGFYDTDFGIVCLEGVGDEPQLFNEDEIRILGKIVGVGITQKDAGGRIIVEPLRL
ncbi:MAG: hypothetical protein JSS81_25505 [Acidobacteria bacterium]|nr:hypothetical protein [Acidobacteriota bacterium]